MADKGQTQLVDNDAYEAFEAFRAARNFFFMLLLLGLLATGASFWMVDYGLIDPVLDRRIRDQEAVYVHHVEAAPAAVILTADEPAADTAEPEEGTVEAAPLQRDEGSSYREGEFYDLCVRLALRAWNYVLPFSAVLYCLVLLIGMKLALVGRLGGLADSGRAFFLGLVAMVLILPWQQKVSPMLWGALYTYEYLVEKYLQMEQNYDFYMRAAYYGGFVGTWGLALLMVVVAQWRSRGASNAVHKRIREQSRRNEAAEE